MDLSSYAGILAGSGRANGEPQGKDILGGGNWDQALLHQMLYAPNGQTTIGRPAMPFGRPADVPANGPLVYAGVAIVALPLPKPPPQRRPPRLSPRRLRGPPTLAVPARPLT